MTASYLWLWNGSAFIKAECDANGYLKVVEQNLDAEGLIQQSAHHKGYNYGTSAWDKVGITANHELKVAMTGLDDYILKSLFDANTILYATTDDTPVALAVAASRILGRKATGDICAMTETELRALLSLEATDIPDLAATKITSGNLAAARMTANIIAAMAGLDPTFSTITIDAVTAATKRNVNNSYLRIMGGTTYLNSANITLDGGDYSTASAWIIIGDRTAGKTPDSKFYVYYQADEAITEEFVIDKSGNVITSGVYDDTVAGTANVIVSSGGHLQRATSNEKDKKDIKDLININTANIFQLRARTFKWDHKITELREQYHPKEHKLGKIIRPEQIITKEHVGLIAEEVERVFPEAASHNIETGEPDGIEWNTIIVALLTEVTKLRNEVNELKGAR